jgi:aspartate kinase
MAIIVQKYGGTSLANTDLIKKVAKRISIAVKQHQQIIVVVSAMAGVTDQLTAYANEVSSSLNENVLAEYDAIITTGEQVNAGLLALELMSLGHKSRSWQAWQLPIVTDNNYGRAKIQYIDTKKILASLALEEIPIISGFQGIAHNNRITSLGRGGSDTTAVAIAAALGAVRCEIYTDVEGVYNVDPKFTTEAKKYEQISYSNMLEISSLGAKVLQNTSVEIAMQHQVPLWIASSFDNTKGTLINNIKTSTFIISHCNNYAYISISYQKTNLLMIEKILQLIIKYSCFDFFNQNIIEQDLIINFAIEKKYLAKIVALLEDTTMSPKAKKLIVNDQVAKISLTGITGDSSILQELLVLLTDLEIAIISLTQDNTKIIFLVLENVIERLIPNLYKKFNNTMVNCDIT